MKFVHINLICLFCSITLGQRCPYDFVSDSGCPVGWNFFDSYCYDFRFTMMTQANAIIDCKRTGSFLIRIDNVEQWDFVTNYLTQRALDKGLRWMTSGIFLTDGTSESITWNLLTPFNGALSPYVYLNSSLNNSPVTIAYVGVWRFMVDSNSTTTGPFVCMVNRYEAPYTVPPVRTIAYGQNESEILEGPCFLKPVRNPWILTMSSEVVQKAKLICPVYGNPSPTITWYIGTVGNSQKILPTLTAFSNYAQQGFDLVIFQPNEDTHSHGFYCEASSGNKVVRSQHMSLTFAHLNIFERQQRKPVTVDANTGTTLDCKAPSHKPSDSLKYQFFMRRANDSLLEVLSYLRMHTFVSQVKGFLGFSDTSTIDSGDYVCQVSLLSRDGDERLGDGINSPYIPLQVRERNVKATNTIIMDGFPAYIPTTPFRGDTVQIECFAFGSTSSGPLMYNWTRPGKYIPSKAYMRNLNRVLIIPNVEVSDEGDYMCHVTDNSGRMAEVKKTTLSIRAKPYFLNEPASQHMDAGTTVTLLCEVRGSPNMMIGWSRNGVTIRASIATLKDELVLSDVAKATHEGIYMCEATNDYGTSYAYAEVRVLDPISPNFNKHPSYPITGVVGESVIIPCRPEGSPSPIITWNGFESAANVSSIDECLNGATCVLPSRYLLISQPVEGVTNYTCTATEGTVTNSSTITVSILPQRELTSVPIDRVIAINSNAKLPCHQQQSDALLDVNYQWFFGETTSQQSALKFDRPDMDARRYEETKFSMPYTSNYGALSVQNIQFDYEGTYICRAESALYMKETAPVSIYVSGPPKSLAGVKVEPTASSGQFMLSWTIPKSLYQLFPITEFRLQLESSLDVGNWTTCCSIASNDTQLDPLFESIFVERRQILTDKCPMCFSAYIIYRMRVLGVNVYGEGLPSPPSEQFQMAMVAPQRCPVVITTGGGKVQTLVVRWEPLSEMEKNGPNFHYIVRFRPLDSTSKDFDQRRVDDPDVVYVDGIQYLQYTHFFDEISGYVPFQVQVEPRNDASVATMCNTDNDTVVIYSAEIVPVTTPNNINAGVYNSTAFIISWDVPPDSERDIQEGVLKGFRINYWKRGSSCLNMAANADRFRTGMRQTIPGASARSGYIIGLDVDTYYCVGVQVYNNAGDGPESSFAEQTTFKAVPSDFPTLVKVNGTNVSGKISVSWVGIQTKPNEESLDGYAIRYWRTGSSVKATAVDVKVGMKTYGTVSGLENDKDYNLRVFGYSRAGTGTLSSPVIQLRIISVNCIKGVSYETPEIRYIFVCHSSGSTPSILLLLMSFFLQLLCH